MTVQELMVQLFGLVTVAGIDANVLITTPDDEYLKEPVSVEWDDDLEAIVIPTKTIEEGFLR